MNGHNPESVLPISPSHNKLPWYHPDHWHVIGWLYMGFGLITQFIAHFDTVCDCASQFTIAHICMCARLPTCTCTHTSPQSCLHQLFPGRGFKHWALPFPCVSELFQASAMSFLQQWLTTEPQQLSDCLTDWLSHSQTNSSLHSTQFNWL
jgi:hypothetical protein